MENNLLTKHTFAICAYKESPFLEECIQSVLHQKKRSEVILITSTPCDYIANICDKYNIPMYINTGEHGITQDWNFAYTMCKTPIVTITHQDDIYFEDYTEVLETMVEEAKRPLIFFSDYFELRNNSLVKSNKLLKIKRIMLWPLRLKFLQSSVFVRRRILSMGSPICCPSIAYFRDNLPEILFQDHFSSNGDWEAEEIISRIEGQFIYCRKALMAHRIHKGSETTITIQGCKRSQEDYEMYRKFWPRWIALVLTKCYKQGEKSNDL